VREMLSKQTAFSGELGEVGVLDRQLQDSRLAYVLVRMIVGPRVGRSFNAARFHQVRLIAQYGRAEAK